MATETLTKQDIKLLKEANKSLLKDFKELNFPFLKVFHASHQLSNPINHYNGYDKTKYNGLTLLILKTSNQYTALFTRCFKKDTYNKVLGTNYVLCNLKALIQSKSVIDCINFEYDSTYVEFSEKELVRQALYHIKGLYKPKTIPTYEDLNNKQLKLAVKNITSELEGNNYRIIFSYDLVKNVAVKTTAYLVDNKTKDIITKSTVKKHTKQQDNRLLARLYSLIALRDEITKGKM